MTETEIQSDVPRDLDPPRDEQETVRPGVETRGPLDPITKHLWRFKRPERVRLLTPFVDHQVKLERWFGRVAANGDQVYTGTILAIARTTIGSAADLVILKTVDGTTWAISTAQVAYIELVEPPRKRAPRAAPADKPTKPTVRSRRRKNEEAADGPAAA